MNNKTQNKINKLLENYIANLKDGMSIKDANEVFFIELVKII